MFFDWLQVPECCVQHILLLGIYYFRCILGMSCHVDMKEVDPAWEEKTKHIARVLEQRLWSELSERVLGSIHLLSVEQMDQISVDWLITLSFYYVYIF